MPLRHKPSPTNQSAKGTRGSQQAGAEVQHTMQAHGRPDIALGSAQVERGLLQVHPQAAAQDLNGD